MSKRIGSRHLLYPLVLAHVNIYKGDRLAPCHPSGERIVSLGYHTVSHWDDTWVYYDECRRSNGETTAKGEIGWLYYRVIAEGREKPTNSDPSVLKLKKEVS